MSHMSFFAFLFEQLVDLKAELFRKQKEYKQQKAVSSQDGNYIVGKKISKVCYLHWFMSRKLILFGRLMSG